MIKLARIGLVLGIFVGIFSALIPFLFFLEQIEDIIYFRGIILGYFICSISSAVLIKEKIFKSIFIGLSAGLFSLIFISTLNLICDTCIKTYWYFLLTFLITFVGFILNIIRLWFNRLQQK